MSPTVQRLASHRKIDVVVLIMAYPGFALHERNALPHEGASRSRVEPWDVGLLKNHPGDADAVELRGFVKGMKMVGDRLEVDGQSLVPSIRIELDAITELVEYAGGKGTDLPVASTTGTMKSTAVPF